MQSSSNSWYISTALILTAGIHAHISYLQENEDSYDPKCCNYEIRRILNWPGRALHKSTTCIQHNHLDPGRLCDTASEKEKRIFEGPRTKIATQTGKEG